MFVSRAKRTSATMSNERKTFRIRLGNSCASPRRLFPPIGASSEGNSLKERLFVWPRLDFLVGTSNLR